MAVSSSVFCSIVSHEPYTWSDAVSAATRGVGIQPSAIPRKKSHSAKAPPLCEGDQDTTYDSGRNKTRAKERTMTSIEPIQLHKRVCVCVCVCERERETMATTTLYLPKPKRWFHQVFTLLSCFVLSCSFALTPS